MFASRLGTCFTRQVRLAEALSERADLQKRLAQLRGRIAASARYQEGAAPDEDASGLLSEAGTVIDALEALVARINATNAATVRDGRTLTALLARRDALRLRHGLLTGAAEAAAGQGGGLAPRQPRSELRMLAALPVAELHGQADDVARRLRELDG